MANFEIFNSIMDKAEGSSADPKEKSVYGVTETAYKEVFGKSKSYTDITYNEAVQVRRYFWNKVKGDNIASQDIANIIADGSFNTGYPQATKHVQRALNDTFSAGLKVDGIFGAKTLAAVNNAAKQSEAQLFNAIYDKRAYFYTNECKVAICPSLATTRLGRYFPKKDTSNAPKPTKVTVSPTEIIGNEMKAIGNPQAEKTTAYLIIGGVAVVIIAVGYWVYNSLNTRKIAMGYY